jgi:hypothetical protein
VFPVRKRNVLDVTGMPAQHCGRPAAVAHQGPGLSMEVGGGGAGDGGAWLTQRRARRLWNGSN